MAKSLADTREEYGKSGLRRSDLLDDPISMFRLWYDDIARHEGSDPNAFTLSTVDTKNRPDARIVLLKGIEDGHFIFYTNYDSTKGEEIAANPEVSMLFFWKSLERQVRIRGYASKLGSGTSEEYFRTRPRGSQLGAWTSQQSHVVKDRMELEEKYQKLDEQYLDTDIPMPTHWGGYKIKAWEYEFWQGRSSRLHDRFRYSLEGSLWKIDRLAP